jgi:hypothetical protein
VQIEGSHHLFRVDSAVVVRVDCVVQLGQLCIGEADRLQPKYLCVWGEGAYTKQLSCWLAGRAETSL